MKTEYIRILNCNYERVLPEQPIEERRYQYCMLMRGGIRYLLPCSLQIMDEKSYLYYDISSKQNISQVFENKKISREWMKHFLCEVQAVRAELERYLLEDSCVVWNPLHIYQDLERDDFCFMYLPYEENASELELLLEFFVKNIDYEDDELARFVYLAQERISTQGLEYLESMMYREFLKLTEEKREERVCREEQRVIEQEHAPEKELRMEAEKKPAKEKKDIFRRYFFFWEGRRKRREEQQRYRQNLQLQINGYAVCEETRYGSSEMPQSQEEPIEEEFGKTIYIEEKPLEKEKGLYKESGELLVKLDQFPFVIGKRRECVNIVLNDYSVSRVHARIIEVGGELYLEDLNSTNGTFKNGLRLQPYEKRRLEEEDEIRFGKLEYIFR